MASEGEGMEVLRRTMGAAVGNIIATIINVQSVTNTGAPWCAAIVISMVVWLCHTSVPHAAVASAKSKIMMMVRSRGSGSN